jgi:hypothetical protein
MPAYAGMTGWGEDDALAVILARVSEANDARKSSVKLVKDDDIFCAFGKPCAGSPAFDAL